MKFKSLKKPRALKPGDTIALIQPAGKLDLKIQAAVAKDLRSLGYFVVEYSKKRKSHSYFSANDDDRKAEWLWAFREPGIDAVMACRGGYGSPRLLAQLSPKEQAQMRCKIFMGYSDLTFAHHWLLQQKGWLSFHGPLVGHLDRPRLKQVLSDLQAFDSGPRVESWSEVREVRRGVGLGRLVGGNLSLLQTSGPAALPKEKMILCLEDVNEDFYRLDRMIWNLILAGYSSLIQGVIVGSLLGCGKDRAQFPWREVESSLGRLTQGPIWTGARFGHGVKHQRLLALGSRVRMKGRRLYYLEGQVSS